MKRTLPELFVVPFDDQARPGKIILPTTERNDPPRRTDALSRYALFAGHQNTLFASLCFHSKMLHPSHAKGLAAIEQPVRQILFLDDQPAHVAHNDTATP